MAAPPPQSEPQRVSVDLLFGAAIFLSAFLLFLVQPMVGKRILPWFGGTPAVWTLCLAFYQTTLFMGYAYAHLLIRFASPALQLAIHTTAVGAALLWLPVLPETAWQPVGVESPSWDIMAMLMANVALPFLVLASTGPLLQAWFVRRHPRSSPYPLYALSNAGSLLALIGYPFLLEPRLSLSDTGTLWSAGFACFGAAVLVCAALAWRARTGAKDVVNAEASGGRDRLAPSRVALWFLLAGCAVVVLMGVTNHLCMDVASAPFLWILPLATYLVTFILCFGSERAYRRAPFVALAVFALGLRVLKFIWLPWFPSWIGAGFSSVPGQIASSCVLLFAVCMIMHGELYRIRPPPRALTAFYLCVSAGGAMGGLFVGIAAPLLFTGYYELVFGLWLAWLLLLLVCARDPSSALRASAPRWRWGAIVSLTLVGLVSVGWAVVTTPDWLLHMERSFFGVLQVVEKRTNSGNIRRELRNGTTLHGMQLRQGNTRDLPTSYYRKATAIGMVMELREVDAVSRVGIIGLGVGTLAAYGRKGDVFRFYEIDPAVVRIAATEDGYFDFLRRSLATIELVVGDARLSLARERAEGVEQDFDILVLDAFNSDAIPIHLLTREGFTHSSDALAEGGLLAVHVSNRHFDLMPLVARLGIEVGMVSLAVQNRIAPRYQSNPSRWVLLSRDADRIEELAQSIPKRYREMGLSPDGIQLTRADTAQLSEIRVWTDDFSDLLGALKPLNSSFQQ